MCSRRDYISTKKSILASCQGFYVFFSPNASWLLFFDCLQREGEEKGILSIRTSNCCFNHSSLITDWWRMFGADLLPLLPLFKPCGEGEIQERRARFRSSGLWQLYRNPEHTSPANSRGRIFTEVTDDAVLSNLCRSPKRCV